MQIYNKQQQAVILKGIAQQIHSMNVPTFNEVDKLLKEFNQTMYPVDIIDEMIQKEREGSKIEVCFCTSQDGFGKDITRRYEISSLLSDESLVFISGGKIHKLNMIDEICENIGIEPVQLISMKIIP